MNLSEELIAVANDAAVRICTTLDVPPNYWNASVVKTANYVADAMRVAAATHADTSDKSAIESSLRAIVKVLDPPPNEAPVLAMTRAQFDAFTPILREAYRCLWSDNPGKGGRGPTREEWASSKERGPRSAVGKDES